MIARWYILSILQSAVVLGDNIIRAAQLEPVAQLEKRNPYYGGFALPQGAENCPANTEYCDSGFCCPSSTWCGPAINGPYCCPTSEDCGTQVDDLPTCADPSWVLYEDAYFFCCQTGNVGIQGAQCQPNSLTFSAGEYAGTMTQANTAVPPATRAGGPSSGSQATTGTGTATAAGTTTTTGSTPSTTSKGHGYRVGGSDQAVLGGVFGLVAMAAPAIL